MIANPKPLLRAEMKSRRIGLARGAPLAGEALAQQVSDQFEHARQWPVKSAVIAGYWPIQSEISPFPLMQIFEDRGFRLCLPYLKQDGDGYEMRFRSFHIGDKLVHGPFDILEPAVGIDLLPDIVLVPLLAFDASGCRLGYGGGYYDRVLASLRTVKSIQAYGVAFSGQQLAEIPFEVHDQRLDGIFTDKGLVEADPNYVGV